MAEVKLLKEEGFVLGKEIKKATEEFTSRDGRTFPAQPERYIVTVVVSALVDANMGMSYMTKMDIKVDRDLFNKLRYLQKIEAIYEYVATEKGGIPKPLQVRPIDEKVRV